MILFDNLASFFPIACRCNDFAVPLLPRECLVNPSTIINSSSTITTLFTSHTLCLTSTNHLLLYTSQKTCQNLFCPFQGIPFKNAPSLPDVFLHSPGCHAPSPLSFHVPESQSLTQYIPPLVQYKVHTLLHRSISPAR